MSRWSMNCAQNGGHTRTRRDRMASFRVWMNFATAMRLHHHHARIELPLGGAFEELVDLSLKQLCDLFLAALLAHGAGNILDFEKVGLYYRSGQIRFRSAQRAFALH